MKCIITAVIGFIGLTACAQSPYLSIRLKMDSAKVAFTNYKIEMKICKPKKMTERGNWFTHDTSTIDFTSLKPTDIDCGEYFDKGVGEPLTYNKEEIPFNKFQFSNQVFAWEEIYVFRISNYSSRAWWPPMFIVVPMKYKSFVTQIDIAGIEFQSGKCVLLTDANAWYDEKKLNIRQSLKNEKGTEVKDFLLKAILESE